MHRLPPLDTLRVFEAAARLKSFKEAGDELSVTASAVSHRISALEAELGTPLFERHARRIVVTPEGERLAAGVRRALAEIRRAVASVDHRQGAHLRISAIPSHVTRWLAPRLHRFQQSHPEIEIQIVADLALVDLSQRTVDVALRFGHGDYQGAVVERLMDDAVVLVASPRYLTANGPVDGPADVPRLTRIIDMTSENDDSAVNWRSWFQYQALGEHDIAKGMRFNGSVLTLEAAANGLGVAVVRQTLVEDDLRSGRLERLPGCDMPTAWGHYMLVLPELVDWPPVSAFLQWLREEARRP
ncbi:MAG: LysR substrate-binding domain-containing protein [Hyphomicrobiaceae bacterium]